MPYVGLKYFRKRVILGFVASLTLLLALFRTFSSPLHYGTVLLKRDPCTCSESYLENKANENIEDREHCRITCVRKDPFLTMKQHDRNKPILLWTTVYSKRTFWKGYLATPLKRRGCSESRCFFTSNKNLVNVSSAIIFHVWGSDLDFRDLDNFLPRTRQPHQVWVFFTREPPPSHRSPLRSLGNIFNWTMTYRTDSDIYYPYNGKISMTTSDLGRGDVTTGKTRSVAWLVSECVTNGGREHYVRQLQKFIDVDVYGKCGNLTCVPKTSPKCYQHIERNYYFYLSFENSICKDYVTEKVFNVLGRSVVPVVFGGADYARVAPPHSYVNALDFESPARLAKFLIELKNDKRRYNRYFEWRNRRKNNNNNFKNGGDDGPDSNWYCQLCKKLHDPRQPWMFYNDIAKWWKDDAKCKQWTN